LGEVGEAGLGRFLAGFGVCDGLYPRIGLISAPVGRVGWAGWFGWVGGAERAAWGCVGRVARVGWVGRTGWGVAGLGKRVEVGLGRFLAGFGVVF
jgi:hypothetical protein